MNLTFKKVFYFYLEKFHSFAYTFTAWHFRKGRGVVVCGRDLKSNSKVSRYFLGVQRNGKNKINKNKHNNKYICFLMYVV